MKIEQYLDSTYLKTTKDTDLSKIEIWEHVLALVNEAITHKFYAVMIRPEHVAKVRAILDRENSAVKLGTVISFPEGNYNLDDKLREAAKAIQDGADELDFVINYSAFKGGNLHGVAKEVRECNELVLSHGKVIKWIIETAALSDDEIARLTSLIKSVTENDFKGMEDRVFVKSSTGFYDTRDGSPNGATAHVIQIMIDNAGNLPVKASGGVRTYEDAIKMINLGVKRIGTSSAMQIAKGASEIK